MGNATDAFLQRIANNGGGGGGAVSSVNDQTGAVVLTAADVGALPDTTEIPDVSGLVPSTRTVAGKPLSANVTLAKADVGLASVDNTADSAKPVSTAQAAAIALKANAASPAFTGTPTGLVKAHVGLGNVDNTADSAKPVSTAQAAAINAKVGSPNSSVTGLALYANVAALPATGTAGVLYFVDAV